MWCFIFLIFNANSYCNATLVSDPDRNISCGVDLSPINPVYEGVGRIETYPWLGILYYPLGKTLITTVVVLVTKQLVIGSANEIDKLPKDAFRARSRVVLGSNCSGPSIRVRDYAYHPEFEARSYSALALVQLDVDELKFELYPICGPPTHFVDARFFTLTLNEGCNRPVVMIHEMKYVDMRECRHFYRRTGLDVKSLWPTHVTCARAVSGGQCVWRGGAVLATKMGGRWHLLGFGVYGPGCGAPARFLDYGVYRGWVKTNVARMGIPAVTRVDEAHIILRRKLANIQRFGRCDLEEIQEELYTDTVGFDETNYGLRMIRYNLTIVESVEYSCVTFGVTQNPSIGRPSPVIRLRRWCAKPTGMCFGFQMIRIDFYVEITFVGTITFKLAAYGKEARVIDVRRAMKWTNRMREKPEIAMNVTTDLNWDAWTERREGVPDKPKPTTRPTTVSYSTTTTLPPVERWTIPPWWETTTKLTTTTQPPTNETTTTQPPTDETTTTQPPTDETTTTQPPTDETTTTQPPTDETTATQPPTIETITPPETPGDQSTESDTDETTRPEGLR